eukprot:13214495-Alexandrium_andersonii.AAC.1
MPTSIEGASRGHPEGFRRLSGGLPRNPHKAARWLPGQGASRKLSQRLFPEAVWKLFTVSSASKPSRKSSAGHATMLSSLAELPGAPGCLRAAPRSLTGAQELFTRSQDLPGAPQRLSVAPAGISGVSPSALPRSLELNYQKALRALRSWPSLFRTSRSCPKHRNA